MAVSTMIGTAKKLYSFAFWSCKMNLRGNLEDGWCDILHIFMRTCFFLTKSFFSLFFFRNIFIPSPGEVLQNWPFFSNAKPCSPDFLTSVNADFKKNVSFWVFFNSRNFVQSPFSTVTETFVFCNSVKKSKKNDFSLNFEKSPFHWSYRFIVYSLQRY